jgi:hypothetical protein
MSKDVPLFHLWGQFELSRAFNRISRNSPSAIRHGMILNPKSAS